MGRRKNRRGRREVKKKEIRSEAKTQTKPRLPDIPEEVIVEILSRFPLKSLSRFTCVSKQWHSLISDISAKKIGRNMVLVQSTLRSGNLTFHSIDEESRVKRVGRPWKKITSHYQPRFAGSCNGLLLIIIDADLFLWNPVTRYFKKVLAYSQLMDEGYGCVSGLCYDSSTNEYKALMALFHESRGQFVVVGSFKSKNWRIVAFPYKVLTAESGPVVNGHLHWYASRENSDQFLASHQIVYFNPHTNMFIEVPMPEPRHEADGNMLLGLGVLDGSLSMVRHDSPSNSVANSVEVLVLKECGMEKSWIILFILSNSTLRSYDKLVPLCCTRYGEALMKLSTTRDQNVRAFNLVDGSHKEILVQPHCDWLNAIMYEESLVTPTGYDWEEEELRGEPTYTEYYLSGHLSKWVRRNGSWKEDEACEFCYDCLSFLSF